MVGACQRVSRWIGQCLLFFACLVYGLPAQNCLTLSTAVVSSGGTASLELSLKSSADTPPAALQWSLQYPLSAISSLTVDVGAAVSAASKTVMCAPNAAGYTCLAVGANTNAIANGVIAKITAVLAPEVSSAVIHVVNPLAVSDAGYFIPISATNGSITTASVSPDRRLRPPFKRIAGVQCRPTQ